MDKIFSVNDVKKTKFPGKLRKTRLLDFITHENKLKRANDLNVWLEILLISKIKNIGDMLFLFGEYSVTKLGLFCI